MSKLSPEFVVRECRDRGLTDEQLETLQAMLKNNGNRVSAAKELCIEANTLGTRMTGIYRKFNLGSLKGPGKFEKLRNLLIESQPVQSQDATLESFPEIELSIDDLRCKVADNIENRCGVMRVLDMERPVTLGAIYTQVNVLEKLTANQRWEPEDLRKRIEDWETFDRLGLAPVKECHVPGQKAVEENPALMVLGKPGSGKTTFLKYLSVACTSSRFMGDRVPIFVTLKEFAEAPGELGLLAFIAGQWDSCGIAEPESAVRRCLAAGRALVLLDGLDEVRSEDDDRTIREIQTLANRYAKSAIVVTCRIAAKQYTFQRFVEVEVADFGDDQIREFVKSWFSNREEESKIDPMIRLLDAEAPVKELATNPLLMTLLCLVFGETADLPRNRAELYKEGVDLLLKKWDGKRNIKREEIFKNISVSHKEGLLGRLALSTFCTGNYFFKQATAEEHITHYIRNLPDLEENPESKSEEILKSIESNHGLLVERAKGIYSFSHLTFHEYFAAKEICDRQAWKILADNLTSNHWREVVVLTASAVRDASVLLSHLKKRIDILVAENPKIQDLLDWLRRKGEAIDPECKKSAIRAFYFSLALARAVACDLSCKRAHEIALFIEGELVLSRSLDSNLIKQVDLVRSKALSPDLDINIALDFALLCDLVLDRALERDLVLAHALNCARDRMQDAELARDIAYNLNIDCDFARNYNNDNFLASQIESLRDRLDLFVVLKNREKREEWWRENGETWIEDFRNLAIERRQVGYLLDLDEDEKRLLREYYEANLLLVRCLNSDCYVSREVRQEIEDTLLLPIAKIEKYRQAGDSNG